MNTWNGLLRINFVLLFIASFISEAQEQPRKVITLVSYTSASAFGLRNRDSVTAALRRMGITYDSLDRNAYGPQDIDYTPWWTLIWSSGDPSVALQDSSAGRGAGALSFKETQDVERYLQAGQKRSLVMAGQNIAFYNGFVQINNPITDTEFMHSYLHTVYRANAPTDGAYSGVIDGKQTDYWKFEDSLHSASPDVVAPSFKTPNVGSEITDFAYAYSTHPATPNDSGAGTSYTNRNINTIFYGFDWADPVQIYPSEMGSLSSGTTRILKGALDFVISHFGGIPQSVPSPDASVGFMLDQNYPNPASELTSIGFTLPVRSEVTLRILDVMGKVISTEIANEPMQAGEQTYTLDASKLVSGSYIYELTATQSNGQSVTLTKKMTLDK